MVTTVLVKFPGQKLSYMEVPTNKIKEVANSVSGLRGVNVEICSLYNGFYYILMDQDRQAKRLQHNNTVIFVDGAGVADMVDISGPFVICKLPRGLMSPLSNITTGDAEQLVKLLPDH